jgi:DNA adenine methylase
VILKIDMIKTGKNILNTSCQEIESVEEHVKPFIRWAGGKQNLVLKLSEHLPNKTFGSYFEPFVGAGSLFFHNKLENPHLSDINPHLINSYISIRDSAEEVSNRLEFHKKRVSCEYYYELRDVFNKRKGQFTIDQAAIFIFLVHTSFNGIYRVNRNGEYNVPFGKIKPAIPDLRHLHKIQSKLKGATITNGMYEDIISSVKRDDFVYFDPPYPPLSDTSFFQHYSIDKFPTRQQIELSEYAQYLNKIGAFVMISNAETPMIEKLYKGWKINKVSAYRYVNCKAERKAVNELIITNY